MTCTANPGTDACDHSDCRRQHRPRARLPLPAQTASASFTVTVDATDPSGANGSSPSGVASIAVYPRLDQRRFLCSVATVTAAVPSATFTGQPGNTYGFYSIATDFAGNVEATPSAAEATTTIVTSATVETTTTLQFSDNRLRSVNSTPPPRRTVPVQSTMHAHRLGSVFDRRRRQWGIRWRSTTTARRRSQHRRCRWTTTPTASYINADDNFIEEAQRCWAVRRSIRTRRARPSRRRRIRRCWGRQ